MARRRPTRYTKSGRPSARGGFYKRRVPHSTRKTRLYRIPRGPARKAPGRAGRRYHGRLLPVWLFRQAGAWQAILPSGEAVDQVVANAAARSWLGRSKLTEEEAGTYSRREYDNLVYAAIDGYWKGRTAGGELAPEDEDLIEVFLRIVRPGNMAKYRRIVDRLLDIVFGDTRGEVAL